jgi:hypothetical protein
MRSGIRLPTLLEGHAAADIVRGRQGGGAGYADAVLERRTDEDIGT